MERDPRVKSEADMKRMGRRQEEGSSWRHCLTDQFSEHDLHTSLQKVVLVMSSA